MLSNDELNIFKTDSLTVSGLVNNNDNEFNFPQPLLSSEDTFTVPSPVDDETLLIASQLISEIEVNNIDGTHRRDNLVGTDSNDIITGFLGADTVTGGDGKDIFVYTSMRDRKDIITDFEVGQDKIDFTKLLDAIGFTGDDPVASGHVGWRTNRNRTDAIITIDQDGKDGRAGHIPVITLRELGSDARENENFLTEVLIDSNSIEVNNIDGTRSRDNLVGTDGNDTITGFLGIDTLTGGDGKDTFVYTTVSPMDGIDIITDFELGQDKIDFTGVLDRIGFTGDDPVASGYIGLGTNRGDPAVNIYRNGGGRGRAISLVRLQGLADDVVDNESFLADVLGLNSDVEVPVISAELLNDTGEDDSDGITSDPTIIGTINTESEVVSLTAGFNETPTEDFVDVTTALLEDGTFELDQELLEDVFGDTLTNGTYTLKLQATDNEDNLSEVIEFEFTLNIDSPIISVELLNDTGEDNTDNITSDSTIVGTINIENEVVSLTAGFNETPPEDFVDVTAALLEDGTFELDQELLENVFGDTLTNGTYTLKLQVTDSGGNLSEIVEFEFTLDLNVEVPIISAELASDTGSDDSDGITSDPTIIGNVNIESEIVSLTAGFNDTISEEFVDITDALLEDGTFELDPGLLEDILGDTLIDGTYTLKLQTTDNDNNLSEVIEFEFTLDSGASDISAELANDTGADDSDGITSVPTIIGTINTASEVVSLKAGFNDTFEEEFVDVTAALSEDGTFELDQELLEDILGETLTNDTYFLNLQSTGSNGIASEVVEIEFTLDTIAPEIFIELANDTGDSLDDKITSDTTIIGTISDASEIISLTGNFNNNSPEEFIDLTAELEIDGTLEFTPEFLENILGEEFIDGTYTLYLQATDEHNFASDIIELEFTFSEIDLPGPEILSLAGIYGLDTYPDAITLPNTGTRQLSVTVDGLVDSPELTIDIGDISYTVADENVLEISDEGLVTATGVGETTITVEYGEVSATIPVLVDEPEIGAAIVDENGGVVEGSDGSLVMLAPGALTEETSVNITPLQQQDLSLPVPEGFEFATAFNLEIEDDELDIPAQLAIPAPEGAQEGTEVWFFRKGALPDETGTWNDIWLQEESGVVDADGFIRTTSPPYPGILRPGEYMAAFSDGIGIPTLVSGALSLNYSTPLAFLGVVDPFLGIGQLLTPGAFFSRLAFTVFHDISTVDVVAVPQEGLPVVTEVGVERAADGLATFETTLDLLAPESDPTEAPVLQGAELKFNDDNGEPFENNEPVLFLTADNALINSDDLLTDKGSRFEDLVAEFSIGEQVYEGTIIPELSQQLDENRVEVAFKVPKTVTLGNSQIHLTRRQEQLAGVNNTEPVYEEVEYQSNKLELENDTEYVFATMASADDVAVIDARAPETVVNDTGSGDLLKAIIPVGGSSFDRPETLAVTSDNNRVYVPLKFSGGVAVIDPMVLSQVDNIPETPDVTEPIPLPTGARPVDIALDQQNNYAYIADERQPFVYVLDIDPFSTSYHQVLQTIELDATDWLNRLAINSDSRRLFVTSSDNSIYVINIDPEDQPQESEPNERKWHEQIGQLETETGAFGISLTPDTDAMTFTNGNRGTDGSGFGVLRITNDDPLAFEANANYINLTLGLETDIFDVNQGYAVTLTKDADYAFVAGRNRNGNILGGSNEGGNIGIIKDPLGPSPELVAATRPIKDAFTHDVVLSNDDKYLYVSNPSIFDANIKGDVYIFDVEEMIETLENPPDNVDLTRTPLDDINPNISVAASNGERSPVFLGFLPYGMAASPGGSGEFSWENIDLTPTLEWDFDGVASEDIKEVNLFVSVFDQGNGLLPKDKVVDVNNIFVRPELSVSEKKELLTKRWKTFDDFNPNRILTATWKPETGKWYGHDRQTEISLPTNAPPNTNSRLTLPDELTLTGGQNYYSAVEIIDKNGNSRFKFDSFETENPEHNLDNAFTSVSVITHGFKFPTESAGIPDNIYNLGNNIAESGGDGLMMRYNRDTGGWDAIDEQGRLLSDVEISDYYGKPLVLLTDWSGDNQSSIPDSGFSEGAADAFFASVVQLDQQLGGTVENIDGQLVNKHGAVFDSPLHFIGFSRGTVVNSEMIQRIGTHFPHAGGPLNADGTPKLDSEGSEIRDLQMTTIDPHDFEQPGFSFPELIPILGGEGFADFNEPQVQVWENVTFADNYYQTVPKLEELTATPAGRLIENADLNIFLGTNSDEENYENSRAGFTRETDELLLLGGRGATHGRVLSWYDGTTNLSVTKSPDELYRRLGDGYHNHLYDSDFPGVPNPWYTPDHKDATFQLGDENAPWEGIGTGWFYSVLGGGKDLRPESNLEERVSVSFDNTAEVRMRGDFAVPTLFNGNFDAVSNPRGLLRNSLSDAIPGWSETSPSDSSTTNSGNSANVNLLQQNLVEWSNIGLSGRYLQGAGYDSSVPNYALKLDSNLKEITHNPFVIPEWGNLRFDVFSPRRKGKLKVELEVEGVTIPVTQINLDQRATNVPVGREQDIDTIKETYLNNQDKIGYGRDGFETFQVRFQELSSDVLQQVIGKPAQLTFSLENSSDARVFIDNVFFKSTHVKLGNPTNARWDATQETPTNLLVEKPGYTVSYNTQTKTPNWVSWQVNQTWTVPRQERLPIQFIDDPFFSLPSSNPNWPQVDGEIFRGLGMDKGHLIPNRDRNRTPKDGIETYMGSNLIAQSIDNNRGFDFDVEPPIGSAWFNIEKMIGDNVEDGKEYYIVAGSLGNDWSSQKKSNAPEFLTDPLTQGSTNPQNFENNISIPEWTWKSAIVLPKPGMEITSEAEAFTYITPNHAEPTDNQWPIEHPFNQLLGEERGPIENREQWREPETWRVALQQLQELLNNRKDPQNPEETDPRFNFEFDFLSHITDQNVHEKLMEDGEYVPF